MKATGKNSANLEQETKTTKIVTYPLLSLASSFVLGSPEFKVTVDLQGCLPKNHSYARRLCHNHRKVYIIEISRNKHFFKRFDLMVSTRKHSSFQLKIKGVMHILWEQPSLIPKSNILIYPFHTT